ncbi:MAG: hypothetical protein IPM95_16100 [Sphingobacteriales bacterium]|nr:hypothetical protein [Sphingobacteriales bacterium]
MKTQTNILCIADNSLKSLQQKIIRTTLGIILLILMLFMQSCKKESLSGPGGVDSRLTGTWQNQEILGSGDVTQTSVAEITFNADGSGFEETFSLGPFGQTPRERSNFSWTARGGNVIRLQFENGSADFKVTITDSGDGMALTFPNGNRVIYSRIG